MPTITRTAPAAAPSPRWRFDVQLISAHALAQYMTFRGFTVRSLAERCGEKQWSTVAQLRSGRTNTCRPDLARKIEKALDAPSGSLFVPRVTTVPGAPVHLPQSTTTRRRPRP